MSKKISYIMSTGRTAHTFKHSLNIILNLPKHNYEIIVCSPKSVITNSDLEIFDKLGIKWIEDELCSGAVHGFNKGYMHSDGDYISTIIDDVGLPENYLDILDWYESPFMKKKRFKIVNSMWEGGPGLVMYHHDDAEDGTNYWETSDKLAPFSQHPYCVIPLATIARETIEKELNGFIYHPDFLHHYCDMWLGFYVCKNEVYEKFKWRCPTFKPYKPLKSQIINRYNTHDESIFKKLTHTFKAGVTPYVSR